MLRNGVAEVLCPLTANLVELKKALKRAATLTDTENGLSGTASIANGLRLASTQLKLFASNNGKNVGSKEILILYNSLQSVDPGSITEFLQGSDMKGVRISSVSLIAELFICKRISLQTGGKEILLVYFLKNNFCKGKFYVPKDKEHLNAILKDLVQPPSLISSISDNDDDISRLQQTKLIKMEFPLQSSVNCLCAWY